ncbi:MAG: 3H domain-containing protein [Clostridium sp.]|uniref:3H domain-containing protein n=1 Tax=Clostridium sp. TaxID=1506 RepID=UPI003EE454A5
MKSYERREDIIKRLLEEDRPTKGIDLAKYYGVTRQVIVKDIAIIKASGREVVSTPDGYMFRNSGSLFKDIIVVKHRSEEMRKEMEIVVKYGGIIEDVIVDHSLYGEIKVMIMVKSLNDINKFLEKYKKESSIPLSILTDGLHMHTISAESKENINLIKNELRECEILI